VFKVTKKNLIYTAVIIGGIFLFSSLIPAVRPLASGVLESPFALLRIITTEIEGIIFYHKNLVENQKLRNQIQLLQQRINALQEVHLENTRLSNLLRLQKKISYKVIAAKVIARSPDSWSSIVVIDKGSTSGIRRDLVVLSYLGLIGRVTEVSSSTSKVMLINDPNMAVSAIVQRSRQEGLISGTFGSSLIMRYLPRDCDIRVSDVIITSGLTENYPKGLLIGRVTDIGEEFSGLSRYAIVKPAVNLATVEEVLIIAP
jgi:rod shape-determining protein MreC